MLYKFGFCIFLATFLSACHKNTTQEDIVETDFIHKKYLHLSHTRTNSNNEINTKVKSIPYENFNMLWLGGDLALHTSLDDQTMESYNQLFNFANPTTLWSLGNHDYDDLARVSLFTNRPPFYTYSVNNICFIVFDTQDNFSNISGAQKDLFNQVLDTIEESTHLVILHHKLIWLHGGEPILEDMIPYVSNGAFGNCFYCINPNNFYTEIYPRLVEVKNKGIEVLCVGGDIGFNTDSFSWVTPEEIHFLASGIHDGFPNNSVIVFDHDLLNKKLEWRFELLENIIE